VRPPVDHIYAPPFPAKLPWINSAALRMDQQRGRPVLIEFWDFCRPNSLRTLPYLRGWHERYAEQGLRTIGVHASGFAPSAGPEAVEAAVARLDIAYPVVVDVDFDIWKEYGNLGWPARYLFDGDGRLCEFHYGEGGYAETEVAIQELLGVDAELLEPVRATDVPDPTADRTRPARYGRCSTGPARSSRTDGRSRSRTPGPIRSSPTSAARAVSSSSNSAPAWSVWPCALCPAWPDRAEGRSLRRRRAG
jgi:hypothetical protein